MRKRLLTAGYIALGTAVAVLAIAGASGTVIAIVAVIGGGALSAVTVATRERRN
jgi:hypothetical protein